MSSVEGKRVLITGAARGIGFHTAREFARVSCQLVLADIDGVALERAAARLREEGAPIWTEVYDVSDKAAVEAVADRVLDRLGGLDVLINNAGIGHSAELAETSLETWHRLMDVNFWGALNHVYAFLPAMKEARSGHIVNISSGQAYFRLPTWGAYAAVKEGLGTFSEILHYELERYGIDVTTVYPFMVNTGFYDGVKGDTLLGRLAMKLVPLYSMSPETVGRIIFKAVKRRRTVENVSILNDLAHYARSLPLVPGLIARVSTLMLARRRLEAA